MRATQRQRLLPDDAHFAAPARPAQLEARPPPAAPGADDAALALAGRFMWFKVVTGNLSKQTIMGNMQVDLSNIDCIIQRQQVCHAHLSDKSGKLVHVGVSAVQNEPQHGLLGLGWSPVLVLTYFWTLGSKLSGVWSSSQVCVCQLTRSRSGVPDADLVATLSTLQVWVASNIHEFKISVDCRAHMAQLSQELGGGEPLGDLSWVAARHDESHTGTHGRPT